MDIVKVALVKDLPKVTLAEWQIFEVRFADSKNGPSRHFVGWSREGQCGQVSSAIQNFDPMSRRGITQSGRIYELSGNSGRNGDAAYVWACWKVHNWVIQERDISDDIERQISGNDGSHFNQQLPLEIPPDFPRDPFPGSLPGAALKHTARKIGDKYVVGLTDEELAPRVEVCIDLVGRLVALGAEMMLSDPSIPTSSIVKELAKRADVSTLGRTRAEMRWISKQVRAKLEPDIKRNCDNDV